jgi:hypothetical protein
MRTSIDLPDPLFRQAKARAALDGLSLKELITRFVELGLRSVTPAGAPAPTRHRSAPPVARPATGQPLPALSNAQLNRLLEEDEVSDESDR